MNIDFPLILVWLTAICGLIYFIDVLFLARWRKKTNRKVPVWIDYGRSFFPVFLIVLVIRSFLVQPFRVPTGSLEPTVQPNDFLAVNQFAYGLRLPVLNTKILSVGKPKRGDIAVFRFPPNPKINYVKRVIGLPGDHIVYKDKVLYVNGKQVSQKFIGNGVDYEPPQTYISAKVIEEDLGNVKHQILLHHAGGYMGMVDVVVPSNQYFMLGDNRDNSEDSRYWGFVPEENLVGKAFIIWMSWGGLKHPIRFERVGLRL